MKAKDIILSTVGATASIGGIIGILLTETIGTILIFVLTALSGLFTLSLINHKK